MSDRLAELRRQRALVEEHLAWLDREIAREGNDPSAAAPVPAASLRNVSASSASFASATSSTSAPEAAILAAAVKAAVNSATTSPRESPVVAAAAEKILEEYRVPPDALKTDVRKGCLLYFVIGFAVFVAGVIGLYFLLRRD